jgi:hypothetical protein
MGTAPGKIWAEGMRSRCGRLRFFPLLWANFRRLFVYLAPEVLPVSETVCCRVFGRATL